MAQQQADEQPTSRRGLDIYPPMTTRTEGNHSGGSLEGRKKMYQASIDDNEGWWAATAKRDYFWKKEWETVCRHNFDVRKGRVFQEWFLGAETNMCYNCVDRHIEAGHGDVVAFFWEGNDVGESRAMTYKQLHAEVTQLAGVLVNKYGVTPQSKVSVYLPMIEFGPIAMLACARIGCMCSVVFGGFSAASLAARLLDSESSVLITAEGTFRGDKPIKLKQIADEALAECAKETNGSFGCKTIVIARHGKEGVPMTQGRDAWYDDVSKDCPPHTDINWVGAEHPLFMLYTSGSTGKPKGLVHTTGGYMVYAGTTFKHVFDYRPGEVYFCTADIGWITGHSYVVFGPLLHRATSVLFEGIPTHPTASRWWELCDKYNVAAFYTAPTAIRSLMKSGPEAVKKAQRSALRVLATVGEPINVAAWEWYFHTVGEGKCDICDTWWQTETGGHMITPLPGTTPLKPGSASLPFFGILPMVLTPEGKEQDPAAPAEGMLCIAKPWPGGARTIYNDHERYEQVYFKPFPGYYFSGDGCRRDEDGYYWLTGRVDDVLNVSGHRLGTSEIECAINTNPLVVESAVVGIAHDIKGEGIYAYVTFKDDVTVDKAALDGIKATVRKVIGPLATPDAVQPAVGLPKTRSGKIMRRILRKIASGEYSELGDVSTLADPAVVEELIKARHEWVTKK